jgi:hypothetical protein
VSCPTCGATGTESSTGIFLGFGVGFLFAAIAAEFYVYADYITIGSVVCP